MLRIASVGEIQVHHARSAAGRLGISDASKDAFDDVDVMLSTIEVTHVE
jgi:hypothetical protein